MTIDEERLKRLLEELIKFPKEVEWVEFKESNWDPVKTGELISGLANSANIHNKPFGYLIFGINDLTHDISGTKFKPKSTKKGNEEIEHWWAQRLDPKANFKICEFTYQGKEIVLFEIPAAVDRPVGFQNNRFVRIGNINRNLKDFPEKEKIIWSNPHRKSFEKEIALSGITADQVIELLDFPNYFELINHPLPANKESILQKLEQDKLISKSRGQYDITNLCAILFAKDIRNFEPINRKAVRVIMYEGKNRIKTLKEQEGTKGYAVGFKGLINYINDKLPSNEEIKEALRIEKKMYPEIAIREIVANALIHQDFYISGASPMVEIFDDRIEISNPGIPLISTDRFIDHSPRSRNEQLASFMRRMNICEERGTGIDKVIFNIELFQLPAPKFEVMETSTKVTLFSYKPLNRMNKEDKIRACYQHCCLKYVSNEKMTNTSLRNRFNIKRENYSIASRIISDTIKAGIIKPYDTQKTHSKRDAKYIPVWA